MSESSASIPEQTKPLWSAVLFSDGNKPVQKQLVPLPPSPKYRSVPFEFYDDPKPKNKAFIIDSATEMVIKYGCDMVRIRKEIHNTASVWEEPPARAPTEPLAMRGSYHGPPLKPRKIKRIVDAPWHYTVEFHRKDTNMWFTAHVYAETQTVKMKHRKVEGIATGKLSVPDGNEIKENPEVFYQTRHSRTNGECLYTLPVNVPIRPRGTGKGQTKPVALEPTNKRLATVAALERDPRR